MTGQCKRDPQCGRRPQRRGMCAAHYEQWRTRQHAYGRFESVYVDSGPARAHVEALRAAGVSVRQVAVLAGVSRTRIVVLVNGIPHLGRGPSKQVRRDLAEKVLAILVPTAALHRSMRGNASVPSVGTVRRLQALVAGGWTQALIAGELGIAPSDVGRLCREGVRVSAKTAQRVEDLHRRWEMMPGPSDRARARAARLGWVPALAWEEDRIDDPDARPAQAGLGRLSILARYLDLRGIGCTEEDTLGRLGVFDRGAPGLLRAMQRAQVEPSDLLVNLAWAERHRPAKAAS